MSEVCLAALGAGFTKAVAVISEDLKEVKRAIGQTRTPKPQSG